MKKAHISREDAETIMIALDQVSQTIDVMNMIVTRLKRRMTDSLDPRASREKPDTTARESRAQHGKVLEALEALDNGSLH